MRFPANKHPVSDPRECRYLPRMEADFTAAENMLRYFKHALIEDTHTNQNTDSLLTAVSIDYTQPLLFQATVLLLDSRK